MKKVLFSAAVATALGLSAVGCNSSSPPGGGGSGAGNAANAKSDDTFTFSFPELTSSHTIKQGDKKTFDVKVNRGKNFHEAVALSTKGDLPKGVTVSFDKATVPSSDGDSKMTVMVAKDAAVGEHQVTVVAKPDKGDATEKGFKIKVDEVK